MIDTMITCIVLLVLSILIALATISQIEDFTFGQKSIDMLKWERKLQTDYSE